jgi:tRNA(Met) C34 N-acetyltransferase TmcA
VTPCQAPKCNRKVERVGDLVCAAHWRRVPRDLRRLMIKEQTAFQSKHKKARVIAAAGLIIAYLETLLIDLPPETP